MKRFRFELVAIALFSVLIGLAALAPTSAHAESGCLDQDRAIFANTIFNLGYQCEVSGDVEMQIPGGSYQRLYDDDDSATALLVRCTDQYGCSARTTPYGGAYVSGRDAATMVVDTFKTVPGLRYMDAKCFPVGCGVTRYFPQLSWPYYTSTSVLPVPAYPPPVYQTRTSFSPGATVSGEIHYSNDVVYCWSCTLTGVSFSGYVVNGHVYPAPFPGTVNGRTRVGMTSDVVRFYPGDTVIGDVVAMDPAPGATGGYCYDVPAFNCYLPNAPRGGLAHGTVNPYPWEIPSSPKYIR